MIKSSFKAMKIQATLLVILALMVAAPVSAAEPKDHSGWDYRFTVYLWGANMTANLPGQDNDPIPFYKLVDNLKMGFMGDFQARKDKWSFNFDTVYMDVGTSFKESFTPPGGTPLVVGAKADLKGLVVTPNAGYAIVDSDKARVEVLFGVRYLDLSLKARLKAEDMVLFDDKISGSNWDGLIGARSTFFLNDKWYIPMYADVGTGDSDNTWQVGAGIGYRFNKVNVTAAYRYLRYNFDKDATLDNLTMKGPALGVSFYF